MTAAERLVEADRLLDVVDSTMTSAQDQIREDRGSSATSAMLLAIAGLAAQKAQVHATAAVAEATLEANRLRPVPTDGMFR